MADPTQTKPTVDHEVSYLLDGFPVVTTVRSATAEQLVQVVERLKAIGAVPPSATPTPASAAATPATAGQRMCPVHGRPLALRTVGTRQFYSCPQRDGDEFCKHTERP